MSGPHFPQKEYFQFKSDKVNFTIGFWILKLVQEPDTSLK